MKATNVRGIAGFAYHFGGKHFFVGLLMQYSGNLAAKTEDHKSPDQRKINHVRNDRIKASDKKHDSFLVYKTNG